MGHRALVAYERPDGSYNLHYSHRGACTLRLKHDISPETPFGGDGTADEHRTLCRILKAAENEAAVSQCVTDANLLHTQVDHDPLAVGLSEEQIITEYLDFLHHEAFYVVDQDFAVTAYRTHWFGLQYDCETVAESPTVGNGALRTVRWYDGDLVGDGYAQGEFRALKAVVGDMVDRGVFTLGEAQRYMERTLIAWAPDRRELRIRTPESSSAGTRR